MIKLTDTQMNVVASACQRPDGAAARPPALNRTAAVKVAAKLIDQARVQEVPAKLGAPIWRMDEEGRAFSLRILKAGRVLVRSAASNIEATASPTPPAEPAGIFANQQNDKPSAAAAQPKTGSKRNLILALMQRDEGATIGDLIAATGWLPHTTRAALTGLRKSGFAVARTRHPQTEASVYRIEDPTAAAAA